MNIYVFSSELLLGGTRGKKVKTGGSTRNKCGHPTGKKQGIKVYDGQRVSKNSLLTAQLRPHILPGWNVRFGSIASLRATCHGRVMLTTEKCDPIYASAGSGSRKDSAFPDHLKGRSIFRMHLHVIPDEQHQYFKLVEQV